MAYPPIIVLAAIICGSAVSISAMGSLSRYLAQRRMLRLETSSRDEIALTRLNGWRRGEPPQAT